MRRTVTTRKATDSDIGTLNDLHSLIGLRRSLSDDLFIKWSWLFERRGRVIGFITMFPYRFVPPSVGYCEMPPDLADDCFTIDETGTYAHSSALVITERLSVPFCLLSFYDHYPFRFPFLLTVQPATQAGLSLDTSIGFKPSLYKSIWYQTIPTRDHLPFMPQGFPRHWQRKLAGHSAPNPLST